MKKSDWLLLNRTKWFSWRGIQFSNVVYGLFLDWSISHGYVGNRNHFTAWNTREDDYSQNLFHHWETFWTLKKNPENKVNVKPHWTETLINTSARVNRSRNNPRNTKFPDMNPTLHYHRWVCPNLSPLWESLLQRDKRQNRRSQDKSNGDRELPSDGKTAFPTASVSPVGPRHLRDYQNKAGGRMCVCVCVRVPATCTCGPLSPVVSVQGE